MTQTFGTTRKRDVVASDTGDNLGEIKSLVVDVTGSVIESIHVAGRGKHAELVPWAGIRSFGTDAVMVESRSALYEASTDHEIQAVKGKADIVDSVVLTTLGTKNGKVTDVEFDETTGAVVAVHTENGVIPAPRIRSLGSFALVVDPE